MTEQIKLNVLQIIGRLKTVYGAKTDKKLADAMKIPRETLATWKRRKTVPVEALIRVYQDRSVDLNWVMFGQRSLEKDWLYPRMTGVINPATIPGLTPTWALGRNDIQDDDHDYCVVVRRGSKRSSNPHITVIATDGSMAPGIERGDQTVVEVFPFLLDTDFDYSTLHDTVVAVYENNTSGAILLRRLLRTGNGYSLYADVPPAIPEPFLKDGTLTHWRIAGIVRTVLKVTLGENIRPEENMLSSRHSSTSNVKHDHPDNDGHSILRRLELARQQVEMLKKSLGETIHNLPDNPRITDFRGCGFSLHSRDLNNVWSPFYHDFKAQYTKLVEIVDKARLDTIGYVLTRIVESGSYPESSGTVKFHPDVIEHLRGLLGSTEPVPETKLSGPGM